MPTLIAVQLAARLRRHRHRRRRRQGTKELREQNGRLKRLLAEAELEKDALREMARGILSQAAKRRAVDMLKDTLSLSERLTCKPFGRARSTYGRLPIAATLADPDADLRAWLRVYATKHLCHGFGAPGPRWGTTRAR